MSDTAREGYLTLAKQTAQGTPATTVTTGLKVTSNDIGGQSENLDADPEIGGSRAMDSALAALGAFHVAGSIEGYLRHEPIGLLLLGLGFVESGAPVALTGGGYAHTFVPRTGDPTFLTMESAWGRNRAIRRFTDVLVGNLELSVSADDRATFSSEVVGIGEAWQATPSVATFAKPDPTGTFLGSAVTLDSLGTYRAQELSVTVENNLSDDETAIGQRSIVDVTPGSLEVTGSLTARFNPAVPGQLTDLYRAALYGSKTATAPQSGEPYHTSATFTFGAPVKLPSNATDRWGLDVVLADVVLSAFPLESSGDDVIEADIEFTAYDNGTDPIVKFVLRNNRSAAY